MPRGVGSPAQPSSTEFRYSGTELEAASLAKNYYAGIISRFAPHLGRRVMEVGAGVGTVADLLLKQEGVEQVTLVEPADNNYPVLQERFASDPRVETVHGYLADVVGHGSADSLVLVNVLEHVPDDAEFLNDAHRVLRPGGKLLIFVPAMPILFGSLDQAFEHYRRYTLGQLRARLEEARFDVRQLHYANLPGAFSWFLVGRVLRRRTLTPKQVIMYDRYVVPWMMKLEGIRPPPFGQSLFAIAQPRAQP